MRRFLLTLLLLVLAAPSWALTFGTGCPNACGVEEIVAGGTTTCTMLVGHDAADGFDPLIVESAQYEVVHLDGVETVPATVPVGGLPIASGAQAMLPVTIATHPGDETLPNGLSLRATASLVAVFSGVPTDPFGESFGDHLTVVPVSTCALPTTTLAPTTTVTTTSTTSTTVQTILGFPRMKVCAHNSNPKKCD